LDVNACRSSYFTTWSLTPPFERDGEHLQTSPFRVGALRLPRRHRADESRRIRQHIADLPVGIREVALALAVAALLLLDRGDARIIHARLIPARRRR